MMDIGFLLSSSLAGADEKEEQVVIRPFSATLAAISPLFFAVLICFQWGAHIPDVPAQAAKNKEMMPAARLKSESLPAER